MMNVFVSQVGHLMDDDEEELIEEVEEDEETNNKELEEQQQRQRQQQQKEQQQLLQQQQLRSEAKAAGSAGKGSGGPRMSANQQTFPCPFCGKPFNQRWMLERHLPSHTGQRPYKCVRCHRRFSLQSSATRHVKNVHRWEGGFDVNDAASMVIKVQPTAGIADAAAAAQAGSGGGAGGAGGGGDAGAIVLTE